MNIAQYEDPIADLAALRKRLSPPPWSHHHDDRNQISAVVDGNGVVVCGSLIMSQGRSYHTDAANHKLITAIVNRWFAISGSLRSKGTRKTKALKTKA